MNETSKKLAEYVDVEIEGLNFILGRLNAWRQAHESMRDNLSHHIRFDTREELDVALAIYKNLRR
jgi:hypothetical protein